MGTTSYLYLVTLFDLLRRKQQAEITPPTKPRTLDELLVESLDIAENQERSEKVELGTAKEPDSVNDCKSNVKETTFDAADLRVKIDKNSLVIEGVHQPSKGFNMQFFTHRYKLPGDTNVEMLLGHKEKGSQETSETKEQPPKESEEKSPRDLSAKGTHSAEETSYKSTTEPLTKEKAKKSTESPIFVKTAPLKVQETVNHLALTNLDEKLAANFNEKAHENILKKTIQNIFDAVKRIDLPGTIPEEEEEEDMGDESFDNPNSSRRELSNENEQPSTSQSKSCYQSQYPEPRVFIKSTETVPETSTSPETLPETSRNPEVEETTENETSSVYILEEAKTVYQRVKEFEAAAMGLIFKK